MEETSNRVYEISNNVEYQSEYSEEDEDYSYIFDLITQKEDRIGIKS